VVIAAMAKGEITPDDAGTIAGVLEARRRVLSPCGAHSGLRSSPGETIVPMDLKPIMH